MLIWLVAPFTVAACGVPPTLAGPAGSATATASSPASTAPAGNDLLKRSTFKDQHSIPWMPLFIAPAKGEGEVKDGAYCVRVDQAGKNPWDVQIRHREITIVQGHTYSVRFVAWASAPMTINVKVAMSGAPYTAHWSHSEKVMPTRQAFVGTFTQTAPDDPTAEFAFHLSDEKTAPPVTLCIDDLHLTDPQFTPLEKLAATALPAIQVNQLGYSPQGMKRATWVLDGPSAESMSKKGAKFELVDGSGAVVYRGETEPFGKDPMSGAFVQRLDFSSYATPGDDLRLRLATGEASAGTVGKGGIVSDPFSIRAGILKPLVRDALRYFYHTRSGIPIEMPFVEDPILARVAGHPTDAKVPCAPDAACTHVLDVSGGWYDAGDYGKYVVNGGLSVWLLMSLWEASQQLGLPVVGVKDKDLHLPESGNGVPDLLDEARWELEWMMKMQVPTGDPQAGLVHHKIHDADWTPLATLPLLSDAIPRQLRPVSTAATLNLAAVGAQGARVFAKIDPAFSARCLKAARRAWAAAETHPALFINASDHRGGGAYEDDDVSDEQFWAAAELFVTTGEEAFFTTLSKSPHYLHPPKEVVGVVSAFNWSTTDTLGTLTLAFDTRRTPAKVREACRKSIVDLAEQYLTVSKAAAFGQPYAGAHYPWGSNSFVLDNGVILAYAHAFTKDLRFMGGAVAAMDYVLGRNPLAKSYVSGYGARPLQNPHHRFWAHSVDPRFPPPPPGLVSGGPNSDLQDPYSKAANAGCIGEMCYVDHIEAYSANEVCINWNAALAWLAGYLNATTQ